MPAIWRRDGTGNGWFTASEKAIHSTSPPLGFPCEPFQCLPNQTLANLGENLASRSCAPAAPDPVAQAGQEAVQVGVRAVAADAVALLQRFGERREARVEPVQVLRMQETGRL